MQDTPNRDAAMATMAKTVCLTVGIGAVYVALAGLVFADVSDLSWVPTLFVVLAASIIGLLSHEWVWRIIGIGILYFLLKQMMREAVTEALDARETKAKDEDAPQGQRGNPLGRG